MRVFYKIVLLGLMVLLLGTFAMAESEADYEYYLVEGTETRVTITKYTGPGGDVVVPATIDGYRVTELYREAFKDCTALTSVYLPDGLESINILVFSGCSNLKSVRLPDTLTAIYAGAFSNCTSLRRLDIPDSVQYMPHGICDGCTNLVEVRLPDHLTDIGAACFRGCKNLRKLNLPSGLKKVGANAFEGCYALNPGQLPDTVEEIGESAFYRCHSWDFGALPGSLKKIGDRAFLELKNIRAAYLPDGFTTLEEYAFAGCTSLTYVRIPSSLKEIGNAAFSNTAITSVYIPEGVEIIGDFAFDSCKNLRAYNIPSTVKRVEYSAFGGCQVNRIVIPEGLEYAETWAFVPKGENVTAFVPKSVSKIRGNYLGNKYTIYCYKNSYAHKQSKAYSEDSGNDVTIKLIGSGTTALYAPKDMSLELGETIQVSAFVFPTDSECAWKSSNAAVAAIDNDGVITALSPGTTTITVTSGSLKDSFKLTVKKTVTDFKLNHEVIYAEFAGKGKTVCTLKASGFEPADAASKTVTWSYWAEDKWKGPAQQLGSENLGPMGAVSSKGVVTAKYTGTIIAMATCGSVSRTCVVHVVPAVDSLEFTEAEAYVAPGASLQLSAVAQGDETYVNRNMLFSSSDETIVHVADDGVVTGISEGEAVITATLGKHTAACTVYVGRPIDSLSTDVSEISAPVGEPFRIPVTITPAELAEDKKLMYAGDNSDVILSGLNCAEAVGPGAARIKVYDRFNPSACVTVDVKAEAVDFFELGANVCDIRAEAFIGTNVQYILIPADSVTIRENAFHGAEALKFVRFDGMTADIHEAAFDDPASIVFLCHPGSGAEAYAAARGIPFLYIA